LVYRRNDFKNITFMSVGERRLFRSVTQPLLWLYFRLLSKCHSKVKLIHW